MDTANNTINTISTEEGEGQTQGAESTGKETSIQDEVNLMQSQRKTDNETSQMVGKTSPKRTKKQKTDRDTPYQQNRTQSKTRATHPSIIPMNQ